MPAVLLLPAADEAVRGGGGGLGAVDDGPEPRVREHMLGRRAVLRVAGQEAADEVLAFGGHVAEELLENRGGRKARGGMEGRRERGPQRAGRVVG